MNTLNGPDNDLTRHLARKADQFARHGGSELEIGQVLTRAGEIRRGRRMRATMVMAACLLAIAVPTALVAIDNDPAKDIQPAPPVPTKIDRSPITLEGLKQGDEPSSGYLEGSRWHDGSEAPAIDLSGEAIDEVARIAGGFLVATNDPDTGDRLTWFVDERGDTTGTTWPMVPGFVVSAGGQVGAFVQPDGTPVVVQDGTAYELPRIPRSGLQPVAVVGEDCTPRAENTGCAVWVKGEGDKPETWVSSTDGAVGPARPDFWSIADVVDGELIAGITDVKDDGISTCSAVTRFDDDTPLWNVCGHHPVAFSPDASRLLSEADGDGFASTGLAVYDAETGDPLLELSTEREASLPQALIWEDATHVLATVFEKGRWAILRIGLDGSREYAVPPVEGEDLESPFRLPSR